MIILYEVLVLSFFIFLRGTLQKILGVCKVLVPGAANLARNPIPHRPLCPLPVSPQHGTKDGDIICKAGKRWEKNMRKNLNKTLNLFIFCLYSVCTVNDG
jgi:hypothetical protein